MATKSSETPILLILSCVVVIGGAKLLTSSLSAPFSIVGCYDLRGERGELANAELRRSVEYSIVISARGSHELGHAYVTWVRNVAGEPYPRFFNVGSMLMPQSWVVAFGEEWKAKS